MFNKIAIFIFRMICPIIWQVEYRLPNSEIVFEYFSNKKARDNFINWLNEDPDFTFISYGGLYIIDEFI